MPGVDRLGRGIDDALPLSRRIVVAGLGLGVTAGLASPGQCVSASAESGPLFRPENFKRKGDQGDAASINRALLEAAKAGGGTVLLDAGRYLIEQPVVMRSQTRLKGSGAARTSLIQQGTPEHWSALSGVSGVITTDRSQEHRGVHVEALALQGLHQHPLGGGGSIFAKNGIALVNVVESSVVDCLVSDTSTGIVMFGRVRGVSQYRNLLRGCTVRNIRSWNGPGNQGTPRGITMATNWSAVEHCTAENCHTGFYVATNHGSFTGCTASQWFDDGFYINAHNCSFRRCQAIGGPTLSDASGSGFAVNPSHGHNFSDCVAVRCPNAGMRFRHAGQAAPSRNRVIGCQFLECGYGFLTDLIGASPYPAAMSLENSFIANTARDCRHNGFLFIRQQRATIARNRAISNNRAGVSLGTRGGISLGEYCFDNQIIDNVCDDPQPVVTQIFGLYSYPRELTRASRANTGNLVKHHSLVGVDFF